MITALHYDYGDFGRLTKMTEKIVGDQSFVTQYEYDQYGNKTGITYPGGFKVKRNYNTKGYLTEIRQASNDALIWQRGTENAMGQPLTYQMGNNQTTTWEYNGNYLPTRNYSSVQDFSYSINPLNGNMAWRKDNQKNLQENFYYDHLNRLDSIKRNSNLMLAMKYSSSGNIASKSDAGIYNYNMFPIHAVKNITTPSTALLNSGHQEVEYNAFHKTSTLYNNQSQRLVIDYGVDQQRMRTRFYKGHIFLEKTKYFAANYEKEITEKSTREITYINTPYGVLAAFIKENGGSGQMYYLYKDHLGSITAITNASGTVLERRSFDAWGRPRHPDNWTYKDIPAWTLLDRGYTGHEHLPQFDLINMNGRMYDPIIGRFLSPDNYVADATNPQDYNRYSYARNNPLKYTDPTGEKLKWWQWGLIGLGGVSYMIDPISTVASLSLTYASTVATLGMAAGTAQSWDLLVTFWGSLQRNDGYEWSKKRFDNSMRIAKGMFKTDENLTGFWRHAGQLLSRWTWESPQTLAGLGNSHIRNMTGKVDRVDYLGSATFVISENMSKKWGVSLGNYININISGEITGSFKERVTTDPLFMHEFGHYLQSHRWGPAYLVGIGAPSLISQINDSKLDNPPFSTHSGYWAEKRANSRAKKYFGEHYGVDWNGTSAYYNRREMRTGIDEDGNEFIKRYSFYATRRATKKNPLR